MGYRDEGEAALHRMARLEDELAAARARAEGLERALAAANDQIERSRGASFVATGPEPRRVASANVWLTRAGLALSSLALFLVAVQGYRSETRGVQAALVALPIVGATVGALVSRRRTVGACVAFALGGGVITFLVLAGFFATVWRSL